MAINCWLRAFQLFAEHGLGDCDVYAEHDMVYVASKIEPDSEAGRELLELGWMHDEDCGWKHFC